MRLGISKSKNTVNYYIIKDYTKNGKRSTKHVLRIGNLPSFAVTQFFNTNQSLLV